MSDFVDSLVSSANGPALLGTLEWIAAYAELPRAGQVQPLKDSSPVDVERAVELAISMRLGELLRVAVLATDSISPWYDESRPKPIFELVEQRLSIAKAIGARADVNELFSPGTTTQWFWNDQVWPDRMVGEGLEDNTDPNRFPMRGTVATCSPFPDESTWSSFDAPVTDEWDLCFGPVSRWSVRADPTARIYEINAPGDWARLVQEFPKVLRVDSGIVEDLRSVGDPKADSWQRCIGLDWSAAAAKYDGVHLSWAGFLTVDARPIPLADDTVTLMRRWGSERTAWLAAVVLDPEPLPVSDSQLADVLDPADPRWDIERGQWETLSHSSAPD